MQTFVPGSPAARRPTHVAVLGPGLLGGSILLAARERLPGVRLSAWSRAADEIAEVRRRGLADVATDNLAEAVRGADLVVLCTPVGAMEDSGEGVRAAPGRGRGHHRCRQREGARRRGAQSVVS